MIAGSDIANGCASSLTEMPSCLRSRASSARRVGSASAAKVRFSICSPYLTIWFSIAARGEESSGIGNRRAKRRFRLLPQPVRRLQITGRMMKRGEAFGPCCARQHTRLSRR